MKANETQLKQVRNYLRTTGQITSWDAIKIYGITRLSQYILLLRKEGMYIDMQRIQLEGRKWYGLYKLIEK